MRLADSTRLCRAAGLECFRKAWLPILYGLGREEHAYGRGELEDAVDAPQPVRGALWLIDRWSRESAVS